MVTPPSIQYANLGMADSLILMVMALVVFGPRRLPQIGRQIGKLMYEFRKASNDFKYQMEEELRNSEEADRRKKEEERQKELALAAPAAETTAATEATPADTGTPSPYPGETTYPAHYPAEYPAEGNLTGAPVVASDAPLETVAEAAPTETISPEATPLTNATTEITEQTEHHG